jgi:hypothetical protein
MYQLRKLVHSLSRHVGLGALASSLSGLAAGPN